MSMRRTAETILPVRQGHRSGRGGTARSIPLPVDLAPVRSPKSAQRSRRSERIACWSSVGEESTSKRWALEVIALAHARPDHASSRSGWRSPARIVVGVWTLSLLEKRVSCSGRRTRTSDHLLNREPLYQLSYAGLSE